MSGGAELYLIWSNEHSMWWGPGRCGYARSFANAGRYTRTEAIDIAMRAIPGARRVGMLPELPVLIEDISEMEMLFRDQYPLAQMEFWE